MLGTAMKQLGSYPQEPKGPGKKPRPHRAISPQPQQPACGSTWGHWFQICIAAPRIVLFALHWGKEAGPGGGKIENNEFDSQHLEFQMYKINLRPHNQLALSAETGSGGLGITSLLGRDGEKTWKSLIFGGDSRQNNRLERGQLIRFQEKGQKHTQKQRLVTN